MRVLSVDSQNCSLQCIYEGTRYVLYVAPGTWRECLSDKFSGEVGVAGVTLLDDAKFSVRKDAEVIDDTNKQKMS